MSVRTSAHKVGVPTAPRRPWARLLAVWLGCAICAGVIPGQALFTQLFVADGVYGYLCDKESNDATVPPPEPVQHERALRTPARTQRSPGNASASASESEVTGHTKGAGCDEQYLALTNVFSIGITLSLVALAPIGLLFDRRGARWSAIVGALLVFLGAALLAIVLYGAESGYDRVTSQLMVLSMIIMDFGSMLNSYALIGLVWHFPGQQALVLAFSSATYQISGFLPIGVSRLLDLTGLPLSYIMGAFALFILGPGTLLCSCTPSQKEYFKEAKRVLGMPLPPPPENIDACGTFRKSWKLLRLNTADHVWTGMSLVFGQSFCFLYSTLAAPYGRALFGSEDATEMEAQLFVIVNGVIGLSIMPFFGSFVDCVGVKVFATSFCLFLLATLGTFSLRSWKAQIAAIFFCQMYSNMQNLFYTRYFMAYASPNLLGSVMGVFILCLSVLLVPILGGATSWSESLPEGPERFTTPFWSLGILGSVFSVLWTIRWLRSSLPDAPHLLPEDESDVAKSFGCKDLEQVLRLVKLDSRAELLSMMSGREPEQLKELFDRIDPDEFAQNLENNFDAEGLAEMLEKGGAVSSQDDADEEEEEEVQQEQEQEKGRKDSTDVPKKGTYAPIPTQSPRATAAGSQPDTCDPPETISKVAPSGAGGAESPELSHNSEGRVRMLSRRLADDVGAGRKDKVISFCLEEPIEDQWLAIVDFEEWMSVAEQKKMDKDFEKLIPGREWAALLRKRTELKGLMTRIMKREMQKKFGRGKRKQAPP